MKRLPRVAMAPSLPAPSYAPAPVEARLRATLMTIEVDLATARSASNPLELGISGNRFFVDPGLPGTVHEACSGTLIVGDAHVTIGPGFFMDEPFDGLRLYWSAQPGKRMRIVYGVDVGLHPWGALTTARPQNAQQSIRLRDVYPINGQVQALYDHQVGAGMLPYALFTGPAVLVQASLVVRAVRSMTPAQLPEDFTPTPIKMISDASGQNILTLQSFSETNFESVGGGAPRHAQSWAFALREPVLVEGACHLEVTPPATGVQWSYWFNLGYVPVSLE